MARCLSLSRGSRVCDQFRCVGWCCLGQVDMAVAATGSRLPEASRLPRDSKLSLLNSTVNRFSLEELRQELALFGAQRCCSCCC